MGYSRALCLRLVAQTLQERLSRGRAALASPQAGVNTLDVVEHAQVLLLELLEVVGELLVPGVQDEDLEAERRGGDEEIGEGDGAGDEDHFDGFLMWSLCVLFIV